MKKRAIIYSIITLMLLSSSGFAAQFNKVLIFPYQPVYQSVTLDVANQFTELLTNEMKNADSLQAIEGPKIVTKKKAGLSEPNIDRDAIMRGIEKAKVGIEEIKNQEYEKAIKPLKDAIQILEKNILYLEDTSVLTDAYLALSVAYFGTGMEDEGETYIRKCIRLDPYKEISPEQYPPLYLRIYDGIRKQTFQLPRGSIKVTSNPSGAVIFVDGKQVGTTPALLKEIIKGEHYIRVERSQEVPFYKTVNVVPNQTIEINVDFSGEEEGGSGPEYTAANSLKNNRIDSATRDALVQVANKQQADFVLFGGIIKNDNNYQINSFFMKVKTTEVVQTMSLTIDVDMLGASIEIYKLVEELTKKIESFPESIKQSVILLYPGIMKKTEKPQEVVIGPVGLPQPLYTGPTKEEEPAQVVKEEPKKEEKKTAAIVPEVRKTPDTGGGIDIGKGRTLKQKGQIDSSVVIIEKPVKWYESPWFWTAVGVVVVGAGVGTYLYISSIEPDRGRISFTLP
ncbi:MAG: PEGA domain-containing protein [Myxococcota bacterium]